jgi:PIN domain nuclease of toxin-antitoxin system
VTLLLDTQIALWWLTASRRLSRESRDLIAAEPCVVSVASVWEVAIKHRLGKLPISARRFRDEMRSAGALVLSIGDEHAVATADLTVIHADPFDRLLLATAEVDRLLLLTADRGLAALHAENPRLPIRVA